MKLSNRLKTTSLAGLLLALLGALPAQADPLPGELLKFQQLPLDNLTYPVGNPATGQVTNQTYWGHDELSTAYSFGGGAAGPTIYQGRFMADDFADKFNSPILHISWWGSYLHLNPDFPVNKFLISFEADVPADPLVAGSFSHPGTPLMNQIVTRGPLAPGSGTFTEKPVSAGGPPLNEALFKYNAELNLNQRFPEHADTVYWLKIVALVDAPPGATFDPHQPPQGITQWGWHNRDYTQPDALASTAPAVIPGEHLDFIVPNTPGVQGWHFQDDAVSGNVFIDTTGPIPPVGSQGPFVVQDTMRPEHYMDDIDGPLGIGQFSKDLAFELYTSDVPEPASCALVAAGLALAARRRGRK